MKNGKVLLPAVLNIAGIFFSVPNPFCHLTVIPMSTSESSPTLHETEFSIRPATPADLPRLTRLGIELSRRHLNFHPVRFHPFENLEARQSAFFEENLANPDARILIAEDRTGDAVGYVFVRLEAETFLDLSNSRAWLHDIYVSPTVRGQGLGKKLLDAATTAAREFGSGVLMLQVWPQNRPAKDIFQQYGFRPTMQEMMLEIED